MKKGIHVLHSLRVALLALFLACAVILPGTASAGPLKDTGSMSILEPMDVMRVLSGSRDRVAMLVFWASWCQPCRDEVPELNKLREAFSKDELTLVGLSVDEDVAAYAKAATEMEFNYPVRRVKESVTRMFNVGTIPRIVVYGPDGKLAFNHEGLVGFEDMERAVQELLEGKK